MALPKDFWRDSFGCYRLRASDDVQDPEQAHRAVERKYWGFSALLSCATTAIALAGAVAAYKAYEATDSQATTARAQLEHEEEPSLQVIDLRVAPVHERGNEGQIQINPVIRNGGVLPAQNVRSQGETAWCDHDHIPGGFFPVIDIRRPDAPFVVAGKQEIGYLIRHQLTEERQGRVRAGSLRPFIFGTLTYDRVFEKEDGSKPPHIVRYCFGLLGLPPQDKIDAGGALTDIYPCGMKTNCADEACGEAPKVPLSCTETSPSSNDTR